MPFKSQAQRRKFGELVKQGKLSQAKFDEWNADTPEKLPERLHKKKPEAKQPSKSDPRLTHVALMHHKTK